MHSYALSDYMRHIDAGRWHEVASMLLDSAEKLRLAGADLLICPDNTAHEAIDLIRDQSPLTWLHIAEEVAAAAAERNFRHLLILGTKYLMEGPVYPSKLRSRAIEWEMPPPDERQHLNTLIFDELAYGRYEESTRSYINRLIAQSKRRGTDAAAPPGRGPSFRSADTPPPRPSLDLT